MNLKRHDELVDQMNADHAKALAAQREATRAGSINSKTVADYAARVRILESQGLTTSDAQAATDAENLGAARCGGRIMHAAHEPDVWECHCRNVAEADGFF